MQADRSSPYAPPAESSSNADNNIKSSNNNNNSNSKRYGEGEYMSSDHSSTFPSYKATQDSNNSHTSARSGNNYDNGDSSPSNTNRNNSSANGNTNTSNANNNTGIIDDSYSSPSSPSHLNPVQYVAVMAENEELKSELEALMKQLENANIQKEEQQKEVLSIFVYFKFSKYH